MIPGPKYSINMPSEFYIESFISEKQLNNQSVSLVIPRITRERIHNSLYYKVNLHILGLRGDTLLELVKVLVRDLGTLRTKSVNQIHMLGGTIFKCLLMKLVEIRPTVEQVCLLLDQNLNERFDGKYIVALMLTYIRIQYYFLGAYDELAQRWKRYMKSYLKDYRKLKTLDLNQDCFSVSQTLKVSVLHMDELVDWLVTKEQIWGIPLGRCQWCDTIYESDSSDSSGSEDSWRD